MRLLLAFALIAFPSTAFAQPAPPAAPCVVDQGLEGPLAAWRPRGIGPVAVGSTADVVPNQALQLEIAEAGTYGFALDIGAWIDVARDGQALTSTGHGHGPSCSSIRKIVDFRLEPGVYTVTLSRTDAPLAHLLVFRR